MTNTVEIVTLVLVAVILGIILIWISCKLWKKQYRMTERTTPDENYHYMQDKNLFKAEVKI